MLLEVVSPNLRPNLSRYSAFSAAAADILIIRMTDSGQLRQAHNINMDKADVSLGIAGNAFFIRNSQYVFGGQSWGFKTLYQNQTYDLVTPTYDSYVFKYDPSEDNDCFYHVDMNSRAIGAVTTEYQGRQVEDKSRDRYLLKEMNNVYLGYSSRYSGAFDLLDTFKYPKMCAFRSDNLTNGVQYYRGQNEQEYVIGKESSSGGALQMMDRGFSWNFLNGTDATGMLGRVDRFY